MLSTDQSWCSPVKLKQPDKKKIFTAYNPVCRKITKQSFSLIRSSVRQWVETARAQTFGHALTSSLPPLKLGGSAQNSEKHPEYKRIVWVKVSPLETAVAADAASSPGTALPPRSLTAPRLNGEQLHWGKKTRCLKPGHQSRWCPTSREGTLRQILGLWWQCFFRWDLNWKHWKYQVITMWGALGCRFSGKCSSP